MLEPVTRQMRQDTEPKSVQELADENQVPRKLAYWNAGHQDQKLELSSKSLQKDDFYLLEYILRFNYPIHTVALKACFLTDDDALGLVEALSSNFVLTSLFHHFTDYSSTVVVEQHQVRFLILFSTGIEYFHVVAPAQGEFSVFFLFLYFFCCLVSASIYFCLPIAHTNFFLFSSFFPTTRAPKK